MVDSLISFEAELGILGFLFNPLNEELEKKRLLQIILPEYFINEKLNTIFKFIKEFEIFDKIVFWDKIKDKNDTIASKVEWYDIESIDDFITEKDAKSYLSIVLDKYEKRQVYYFGRSLQTAMAEGKDQFQIALEAQNKLLKMTSKVKLEDNSEILQKVLSERKEDVITTGYDILDGFIGGYSRGVIVTIAGDSGHLKTTLALDAAFRMAEKNPTIKIAIFSKEMTAENLMKKQISRICGIPSKDLISQNYDKEYVKKVMNANDAWRENRIRIINPDSFGGVGDIARIQMTHRFDVWFLDFIQLLEFNNTKSVPSSSDYNIQVGQNMRSLLSLALITKSVGIVLSQVRKGIENREQMKPTISDMEWSGLIKQLSSYVFFSYYPGKYYGFHKLPDDYHYIIGEKTRFSESFIFPLKVNPELGTFAEITASAERQERVQLLKSYLDKKH